jgi:hypothetical protein
LELEWRGQRIVFRSGVIQAKNGNAKAADKLISSLLRKNWLEFPEFRPEFRGHLTFFF